LERDDSSQFASPYCSLGGFLAALGLPEENEPKYVPVCYGGVFAAKRSNVQRHSTEFWYTLEKMLMRENNIQEGHYLERSWAYLLSNPLASDEEEYLDLTHTCGLCDTPWYFDRCGVLTK